MIAVRASAGADEAVHRLIELSAAGLAVPEGLRAAAAEAESKRLRRGMERLAKVVEQGGVPAGFERDRLAYLIAATAVTELSNSAASASPGMAPSAGIGQFGSRMLGLTESDSEMQRVQHRIKSSLWMSLTLLMAGGLAATMISRLIQPSIEAILFDFQVNLPPGHRLFVTVVTVTGPLVLIVTALGMLTLLMRRFGPLRGIAETLVGCVPLAGRALDRSDIAVACDAIWRGLAAGLTYESALRTAMPLVRSARLARWLNSSAARLESGGSLLEAIALLPIDPEVLPAIVGPVGPAPERPHVGWYLASHYFRRAALRDGHSVSAMPALASVLAASIGWMGMAASMASMTAIISIITAL